MKKYFLFDLDGTVSDTGKGILTCAQYALDFFGIHGEPEENLRRFVGPPLHLAFERFYGFSPEQAQEAVKKYRERYFTEGVRESPLYPGMKALLEELSQKAAKAGGKLCLATSKPLVMARQILEWRGVKDCFSLTVGANLDGSMTDKAEVVGEVLRQLGSPPPEEVLMIGDREYDVKGAKVWGLETVGVLYGYAAAGELEAAGADRTVSTVEELKDLLLSLAE